MVEFWSTTFGELKHNQTIDELNLKHQAHNLIIINCPLLIIFKAYSFYRNFPQSVICVEKIKFTWKRILVLYNS